MAKVLVCDPISDSAISAMKDGGHQVDVKVDMSVDELKATIPEYEGAIVRSATKLRKEILEKAGNLKVIVRAGVGLDNIDVDYAMEKGIEVRNTPAASSDSVAELTLAHLFALARYIPQANITMRKGEWNKKKYGGFEIAGKLLGIIGCGRIGQSLAKKAIALGMNVVGCDPYIDKDKCSFKIQDLDYIFKNADVISLHIPHTPETHYIIDKEAIDKMKDGVVIINCARGGLIDEDALLDALNSGKVAFAAMDVFEEEPPKNMDLINHPNVSVTPHIGAQTKEAKSRVGAETAKQLLDFFK